MGEPTAVSTGTAGQVITSNGEGMPPSFQSVTVASGIGITATLTYPEYTKSIDNTIGAYLGGNQSLTK